ncbi:uncharacterized protein EI97DRAFT_176933 [Westerdykella ornata]|uniref:Uncharacterized protein n=1 Tax=Westerdykella ornata TaxID=318751 RepID=A0A6A6JWL5_WESOR|nr:uncharacterized protein EI97DRAFT_176933 [Westerdykella ornata]KAF2279459.1 hypothetical protein EI97DRAFT_176933 [Westerdykella ornata]
MRLGLSAVATLPPAASGTFTPASRERGTTIPQIAAVVHVEGRAFCWRASCLANLHCCGVTIDQHSLECYCMFATPPPGVHAQDDCSARACVSGPPIHIQFAKDLGYQRLRLVLHRKASTVYALGRR